MFFNIFILFPRIISPVRGSFSRLMFTNHIRHALTRITSVLIIDYKLRLNVCFLEIYLHGIEHGTKFGLKRPGWCFPTWAHIWHGKNKGDELSQLHKRKGDATKMHTSTYAMTKTNCFCDGSAKLHTASLSQMLAHDRRDTRAVPGLAHSELADAQGAKYYRNLVAVSLTLRRTIYLDVKYDLTAFG